MTFFATQVYPDYLTRQRRDLPLNLPHSSVDGAALTLRKAAKSAATLSLSLDDPAKKLKTFSTFEALNGQPGLYVVGQAKKTPLYVGEALDLGKVLSLQVSVGRKVWESFGENLIIRAVPSQRLPSMDLSGGGGESSRAGWWLISAA